MKFLQDFWMQITGGMSFIAFLAFIFRDWIKDRIIEIFKPKEKQDIITRAEFEPRMAAVTEEIHFIHSDLSDKLLAHAAQARQDSRDLRAEMERRDAKMFEKIDAFLQLAAMNQRDK